MIPQLIDTIGQTYCTQWTNTHRMFRLRKVKWFVAIVRPTANWLKGVNSS